MQLVPIERHRAQMRWQFLGGVLVGCAICAVVMIPTPTLKHTVELAFRYAGGTKPGSPAPTTTSANRAAQPSAEQPVSVAAPTGPPQRQSPHTAGASSRNLMTRTASPSATPQPVKAEQPLGSSQAAVAPPAASRAHSSSGQVQHAKKVSATPRQLWSAVQTGNMKAAVELADLYARGEVVPVNCEQARVLLLLASEKNNAEASKKLQELDKGGCPANSE
jgi:hypothetical protein